MLFYEKKLNSVFDFGSKMENRAYSMEELQDEIERVKIQLEEMEEDNKRVVLYHPLGEQKHLNMELVKLYSPDYQDIDIKDQIRNNKASKIKDLLKRIYIEEPNKLDYKNYNIYLKSIYFLFFTKFYVTDGAGFLDIFNENKKLASFNSIRNSKNSIYINFLFQNMLDELDLEDYIADFSYRDTLSITYDLLDCITENIGSTNTSTLRKAKTIEMNELLYGDTIGSVKYYLDVLNSGIAKSYLRRNNYTEFKHNNILYITFNKLILYMISLQKNELEKTIKTFKEYDTSKSVEALLRVIKQGSEGKIKLQYASIRRALYSDELLNICFPELKGYFSKKKKMKGYNIEKVIDNMFENRQILNKISREFYLIDSYPERNDIISSDDNGYLYISKKNFYATVAMVVTLTNKIKYESIDFNLDERSNVHKKKIHRISDLFKAVKQEETNRQLETMTPLIYKALLIYVSIKLLQTVGGEQWEPLFDKFKATHIESYRQFKETLDMMMESKDGLLLITDSLIEVMKIFIEDLNIDVSPFFSDEEIGKIFS